MEFEARTDGFRVIENGSMIASLCTRQVNQSPPEMMPEEQYNKLVTSVGQAEALKTRDQYAADRKARVTCYEDLPRDQCRVHSAIGELTVGQLEAILAHLKE